MNLKVMGTFIFVLSAAHMTLFGCANNKKTTANKVQGKAQWEQQPGQVTKATPSAQSSTSTTLSESNTKHQESDSSDLDKNKAAKDLNVLVPPPGYKFKEPPETVVPLDKTKPNQTETTLLPQEPVRSVVPVAKKEVTLSVAPTNSTQSNDSSGSFGSRESEKAIKALIEQNYMGRKPYNSDLVKSWILSLFEIDKKETRDIVYGNKYKRTIQFKNDSATFIKVFEALAVISGQAVIPIYDNEGNLIEEKKLAFGGALLSELDGQVFNSAEGKECDKVLCALTSIFKSEAAAIDVMFIYFRYQYLITLQGPLDSPKDYTVIPASAVREIAEVLWSMPSTFYKLKSLLTIRLVRACDPKKYADMIAETDMACQNYAGMFQTNYYLTKHDSADNKTDMKFETLAGNLRLYTKDLDSTWDTFVHELAHAYDHATHISDKELSDQGIDPRGPELGLAGHISTSKTWLSFSGWKYIGDRKGERTIPPFIKVSDQTFDNILKVNRVWDLPANASKHFWWSYGMSEPSEDFATSVEAYVLKPKILKQHVPAKYDYLNQTVFMFHHKGQGLLWEY